MAKTLQLTFLTEGGKKVGVNVDEPKDDLTEENILEAAQAIISSNIFTVDGYAFESIATAKIVERNVQNVFEA